MNKFKRHIVYLVVALLGTSAFTLTVVAHAEGESWGHHMTGGFWGWGPMVLFWISGVLLVVLLTVALLKSLQDS